MEKTIERLNKLILNVWSRDWDNDNIDREKQEPLPAFYRVPTNDIEILFIGMNPSLNKNDYRNLIAKELKINPSLKPSLKEVYEMGFSKFITRDRGLKYSINSLLSEIKLAEDTIAKHHNYTNKPKDIADYLKIDFTKNMYLTDLFFIRKTNQSDFLKQYIYKNQKNLDEGLTVFATRQLKMLTLLIRSIEPKIILISNARASEIFHKFVIPVFTPNDIRFSEKIGTYIMKINDKSVPIFYSSMLSGQRALDLQSFERLKWHMKMIKDGALKIE